MDTDLLLAPLSASSPCGEDLSFSTEFDQIADMRRADDPTLNQGEWLTPLKQADWAGVAHLCTELLRTRTKDLRLALWRTEALAMVDGHGGLHQGLGLCAALCEQHWPDLHPLIDGHDAEERIGNMAWLLQRLTELVPTLTVATSRQGERHSLRELSLARQQHLQERQTHADATGQPPSEAAARLARFKQALSDTPPEAWRQQLEAARGALAQLQAWQAVVDQHLGADGPSFVAARESLAQAIHELDRIGREAGLLPPGGHGVGGLGTGGLGATGTASQAMMVGASGAAQGSVASAEARATQAESTSAQAPWAPSPPRTREDALRQLREVAHYFRRTEPHSPVAYLADKAVKWGEMPLHLWLAEVVKDQGAMAHLQELLGLPHVDPHAP